MHLLKFKKKDKKENYTENEQLEAPSDDHTFDIESIDIQEKRSSKIENDNEINPNDPQEVNQTDEEELDIPSKQELLPVLEELAAFIYQLEYNRGIKDVTKEDRPIN